MALVGLRRWWVNHFGSRAIARDFEERFGELARYNTERARGVQHTSEYDAQMAALQREFDAWIPPWR